MKATKTGIIHLPLVALRGLVVFPQMVASFDVGRQASVNAIERALEDDERLIVAVTQRKVDCEFPGAEDLYSIGTLCAVKQVIRAEDNLMRVIVEGLSRVKFLSMSSTESVNYARARLLSKKMDLSESEEGEARMRLITEQFEQYAGETNRITSENLLQVISMTDAEQVCDTIAYEVLKNYEQKQEILSILDPLDRMDTLYEILSRELNVARIERKVGQRVREQMDQQQKEYYLHEQIRAIQTELGDDEKSDAERLQDQISKLPLNEEAREKVDREFKHLLSMPPSAPETPMIHSYIEWVADLPWGKESSDNEDLEDAERILNADHYGLEKVKERILEYLAVKQLTGELHGPILCFVGPPGVGKTSVARSIARALGRKFTRMSLGGVHDEAEIRGHRRTYIGSMPGRIITNMKLAGSMNPVFLFDEVDKMGADYRGDPTSALLEVLDPAQNSTFRDNYMEFPFDLSKVIFLATANTTDGIPDALLDRMEVIYLSGYTEDEKLHIARQHLLPRQLKEHGLDEEKLKISDETIIAVIRGYTREAGVRTLERTLGAICRKVARQIAQKKVPEVVVAPESLKDLIGNVKYLPDDPAGKGEVGVTTGLAWTEVGGETLCVEANIMPGDGKLQLTGSLGDVMKESAQAALSYIRAHCAELGIQEDFYNTFDIHIHVPEGAIPKDGPSAGITMATTLISALTRRPVPGNLAMTGEITLRGRVLPIGGLKEKALAAHRLGIRKVIMPQANVNDLDEIPQNVRDEMTFIPVETMDEVLKAVFGEKPDGNQES